MKRNFIFGLLFLTIACAPPSQDADFKAFIKSFHQSKWKKFPAWAVKAGHKQFDHLLPIPNQEKHHSNLQFCKKYYDTLQTFDPNRLSVPLKFEYNKIKPFLSKYINDIEYLKIYETDPTYYDLRNAFALNGKSLNDHEIEILESKLKIIPDYYSAAKQNLKSPNQEKLQEAVEQQIQFYAILNQLSADKNLILEAKLSVKDYIAFCKSKEFEYLDGALNTVRVFTEEQVKKVFTVEK
jgi:hypothetical protein